MGKDEISLKQLLLKVRDSTRYLWVKKKWIILFALIGMIAGLSYAFLKKPEYTATISFVTENDKGNSSGLSLYSGLASQFGINLGNMGINDELFSGDNIFDLMKTRLMLQRTLLTSVVYKDKPTLLINRYIEIEELRQKKPSLKNIYFHTDTTVLTPGQNAAIKLISRAIIRQMDYKSGSIMSASFTSKDELFSQAFLKNLMENVEQFYISTKTKKARENVYVLQKQLDSVKNQLYGAMGNVAAFQDINQNLIRQAPRVQQQKSSMKVSINSAIYQQLVTGLETAKMTLQQETPLFEVIDTPVLPLDKNQPGKLKWALAGVILGIMLSSGWLLLRLIYKGVMSNET